MCRRIVLVSLFFAISSHASGENRHVPRDHASIQAAIDAANDADTIVVAPGTYDVTKPIVFRGKAITLKSAEGPAVTTVRMREPSDPTRGSVFAFENAELGARLEGFTITGGSGLLKDVTPFINNPPMSLRVGGGIYCGSHVEASVVGCLLRENVAQYGGGLLGDVDSWPSLEGTEFIDNRTEDLVTPPENSPLSYGGAIACLPDSQVTIEGGRFTRNRAYGGGAVFVSQQGSLTVRGAEFEENTTDGRDGGAILSRGDGLVVTECTFLRNRSEDDGGAIYALKRAFRVEDCFFEENRARDDGGGLFADLLSGESEPARVVRCRFLRNFAVDNGGGACVGYESGHVVFEDCTVEGNTAAWGGGIYFDYESKSDAVGCIFASNQAVWGGGARCDDSYTSFQNCTFCGNGAGLGGGIDANANKFSLTHCIVWGNAGGNVFNWRVSNGMSAPDVEVHYCCIEGDRVWPGEGNIHRDPLFEGWATDRTVYVNATYPGDGDGTESRPYRSLPEALDGYSLALAAHSPCLGTGRDGSDMGADTGIAAMTGHASRLVRLSPGRYSLFGVNLSHGVSLDGAGKNVTVLEGTLHGLRTGRFVEDVTVTKGLQGGIVTGSGESPQIRRCRTERNWGRIASGGISVFGPASPLIEDCTVTGNSGYWSGGGVSCRGNASPSFVRCTISGNVGTRDNGGSAVYCWSDPTASAWPVFVNCLITGNSGFSTIYCGGPIKLLNCTVANNDTKSVESVTRANARFVPEIVNCVFWNHPAEEVPGNLSHSLVNTDPLFVSEGIYGFGQTTQQTIEGWTFELPDFMIHSGNYDLQASSSAIDTGTAQEVPQTDIRGTERPRWEGVDVGAYEYSGDTAPSPPPLPLFQRADVNLDGSADISDAILTLTYLFVGDAIPTCLKSLDINDSGEINLTDPIVLLNFLFLGGPAPAMPFDACGPDPTLDFLACDSYSLCE